MTLTTLTAYRQWQQLVDAHTATPSDAIMLRRNVLAAEGEHEAGVFTSLALAYAEKARA